MFYCIYLKKLIIPVIFTILAVFSLTAAIPAMQAGSSEHSQRVPIIMYHGLTEIENQRNQYMISPELFEDDLKYLRDNGYEPIFLSELTECIENGRQLPEKAVILTFDDGYLNNYKYAYPLLKKYSTKAVISPIAKAANEAADEKYRNVRWSQCTWEQLREMKESGLVEIQNHSYDLHHIEKEYQGAGKKPGESEQEYKKRLEDDFRKAHELIEKNIGKAPTAFIYPFGAKSEGSNEVLLSLGYSAALDCEGKMNYISTRDDLMKLHRFLRPDRTSSEEFFENILSA